MAGFLQKSSIKKSKLNLIPLVFLKIQLLIWQKC